MSGEKIQFRTFYYLIIPLVYTLLSLYNYTPISLAYSFFIFLAPLLEVFLKPLKIQDNLYSKNRWLKNYGISIVSYPVITILTVITSNYLIHYPQRGILGNFQPLPLVVESILAIVIIDFLGYIFHFLGHKTHFLWRFHQIHHSDQIFDSSLTYRLHPIESILFTLIVILIAVFLIGFSFTAIAVGVVVRMIFTIGVHININISQKFDNIIRKIFVTPKMHLLHHSQRISETNSNYGIVLSLWDKIFSTYNIEPSLGYEKMEIGLDYEKEKYISFSHLIFTPFYKKQKFLNRS